MSSFNTILEMTHDENIRRNMEEIQSLTPEQLDEALAEVNEETDDARFDMLMMKNEMTPEEELEVKQIDRRMIIRAKKIMDMANAILGGPVKESSNNELEELKAMMREMHGGRRKRQTYRKSMKGGGGAGSKPSEHEPTAEPEAEPEPEPEAEPEAEPKVNIKATIQTIEATIAGHQLHENEYRKKAQEHLELAKAAHQKSKNTPANATQKIIALHELKRHKAFIAHADTVAGYATLMRRQLLAIRAKYPHAGGKRKQNHKRSRKTRKYTRM